MRYMSDRMYMRYRMGYRLCNLVGACVVLALAACAAPGAKGPRPMVSSVSNASGTPSPLNRLSINVDAAWNRINFLNDGPTQIWTMEGLAIDQMLIYAGIKDDQALHATVANSKVKAFKFRSNMQPDEIVAQFEGMLTRDGSRFTLVKLEPSPFGSGTGSGSGFRFEFELVRRINSLTVRGVGYGAVSKGELFAMLYIAPRLHFYPRHIAAVEKISASARVTEE
jgi:hypothetical protein